MTSQAEDKRKLAIPVTCVTGFLGAGKTTTILGILKQLPKDFKVVLLKNEYGDVEVDSLLANQSQITGVSEILNGCMCCTMVGLVENALMEIKDRFRPDRIIIESSGSAFPATLALQIRQLEPQGFTLDGVITVIDCVNFRGYEDTSPTAKLQAKYTDLLLLSKHQLVSERDLDILMDHLGALNDTTPRIKVSPERPAPLSVVFGLDTSVFDKEKAEAADWKALGAGHGQWHGDEVEVRSIWRGGSKPDSTKRKRSDGLGSGHVHVNGETCSCEHDEDHEEGKEGDFVPILQATLEDALEKLSFEIYRVKGIVRLAGSPHPKAWRTCILNYAFGRYELTYFPSLDEDAGLDGVSLRLTVMGERGEVASRAKKLAIALDAQYA
ncbi:CobW/HypB/UreG, nucleotide-binding domain-domain-containing protein [Kockovaella imperatae]|uniref:CobW/HypB/UreG, nucleotide-binding domain-domain-containing protein n=1 Tax=Kockovaella imperatae TaxID=4999 RepID=A0A1Y1UEF6_9TREE|nr:CobW/HypB/UreG, nucleotide-binding domain-domain-containing protein [Kockovaella imperatae]ORX35886.1 CobW/HypB/UreG, nucleotide-binding domain-domain-containing protein [Kockovaella imperatae]